MGLYYEVLYERNYKKIAQNLKKAMRKILFKSCNAKSLPLFEVLSILSFYKQKTFAILQVMWKLYNNNIPENISGLFQLRQRIYGANNLKYLDQM